MIEVFSALLFTGAFALAVVVLGSMLAADWRRVTGLLLGDRSASDVVMPAPIRLQARRWTVAPGPSRAVVLRAAA